MTLKKKSNNDDNVSYGPDTDLINYHCETKAGNQARGVKEWWPRWGGWRGRGRNKPGY